MSDVSQGPGWWQASDGKWYPPELAPGAAPPPPPVPQTPAPQTPQPTQPPQSGQAFPQQGQAFPQGQPPQQQWQQPRQPAHQQPVGPPPKQGMSGCAKALLIGLAICAVLALAIGACTVLIADDVKEAFDEVVEEAERVAEEAEQAAEEAAAEIEEANEGLDDSGGIGGTTGEVSGVGDLQGCESGFVGTVEVSIVNSSPGLLDYRATVLLLDDEGENIGTEEHTIRAVVPGESVVERIDTPGIDAANCDVAALWTSPTPTDTEALADVGPCNVNLTSASAIPAADATNSLETVSDYEVLVAVIDESGARRGLTVGRAEAVEPGSTVSLGFSPDVLALPPGEFTCEVRVVNRSQ